MQKLIKQLKNWLILKLGGYTLPMSEFKVYRPKPIELCAILKDARLGYIPDDEKEKQLVHMIAEEIKTKKLYELQRSLDFETGDVLHRMKVLVVEPF